MWFQYPDMKMMYETKAHKSEIDDLDISPSGDMVSLTSLSLSLCFSLSLFLSIFHSLSLSYLFYSHFLFHLFLFHSLFLSLSGL